MKNFYKHIYVIFWVALIAPNYILAQSTLDFYQVEKNGYFTNPVQTPHGVVCTDNYSSRIYLINSNKTETLVEFPGCGRYFNLSPDRNIIAYKHISDEGQSPLIYKIPERLSVELCPPVEFCGQPTFDNSGRIYFTQNDSLRIHAELKISSYSLGFYTNWVEPSPDGSKVAFVDENESISILNIENNEIQSLDSRMSSIYPRWSPDGLKLTYSSISGDLYIWDSQTIVQIELGKGGSPTWTSNSKQLIYQKNTIEGEEFTSDLYLYDLEKRNEYALTKTKSINECNPSCYNGEVLYHTLDSQTIDRMIFNADFTAVIKKEVIANWDEKMRVKFYPQSKNKSRNVVFLGESPYVNQMYDTPDFHDGTGSCGPTTAIMTLAYYNRLPAWPTQVDKLYLHNNDYGSYIADQYHFNEYFYDEYTSPYGSDSWGGYSYMWGGSGSPNSTMASYYDNHLLETYQQWTSQCTFQKTIDEIDAGFPQTICAFMTVSGHILMAKGYEEVSHSLVFHDPYGNKNTPGYPSYDGNDVIYDWPGYNNGNQNLDPDGSHGGVAWTIKTQSEIPLLNDTIIDDMDFGHGFYIYNEPPSHMKYFRDQNTGFKSHSWWTISIDTEDVCYVTWQPEIPEQGFYEVSVYIPSGYANAQNSIYKMNLSGIDTTTILNQNNYNDEWVLLGWFDLHPDSINNIYLGDSTGYYGEYMAFDAVKVSRTQTVGIDEFNSFDSDVKIFPNPANDIVRIELPETARDNSVSFEVFNTSLQLIDRLQTNNSSEFVIAVSTYKNGTYLLKIISDKEIFYSRFIVMH